MHVKKIFSLEGKCAVVIGGAGKIGLPMAQSLAESGAKVYIASRNEKNYLPAVKKLQSEKLSVEGITLDQSNESCVLKVLNEISNNFKTPDILINAGCYRPMKNYFDEISTW